MATIANGSAAQPTTEATAYVEVPIQEELRRRPRLGGYKFRIRNLLSAAGIFFALLLILGAIILHTRQKSHFGRMNIELRQQKLQEQNDSELILPFEVVTAPAVAALRTEVVNEDCLGCIAATTTANKSVMCGKSPCGIYGIYRPYWQDALRTVTHSNEAEDYESCVSNPNCGAAIVRGYIKSYPVDCDGDGTIGCKDHIMLHLLGPRGCVMKPLPDLYQTRMDECLRVKKLK